MILLIDIGNTLTKLATSDGKSSKNINILKAIDTHITNYESILNSEIKKLKSIDAVVISSVVNIKKPILSQMIFETFKMQPMFVDYGIIPKINLKIELENQQLGSDLIAIAVAGGTKYLNCIAISLGTAITYSIIQNQELKGVIIGPGYTTTKNAFVEKATAIEPFRVVKGESVIGKTTIEALSIGFGNGFAYMIEQTVSHIKKELGGEFIVVITGGDFEEIKPFITIPHTYDETLLMFGLNHIYYTLNKGDKYLG